MSDNIWYQQYAGSRLCRPNHESGISWTQAAVITSILWLWLFSPFYQCGTAFFAFNDDLMCDTQAGSFTMFLAIAPLLFFSDLLFTGYIRSSAMSLILDRIEHRQYDSFKHDEILTVYKVVCVIRILFSIAVVIFFIWGLVVRILLGNDDSNCNSEMMGFLTGNGFLWLFVWIISSWFLFETLHSCRKMLYLQNQIRKDVEILQRAASKIMRFSDSHDKSDDSDNVIVVADGQTLFPELHEWYGLSLSRRQDAIKADNEKHTTSLLELAILQKNSLAIRAILDICPDVFIEEIPNEPLLHSAVENLNSDDFQLLLPHIADIEVADKDGLTALQRCCVLDDSKKMDILMEFGADETKPVLGRWAIFAYSAASGSNNCMIALWNRTTKATIPDNEMQSALKLAIANEHIDSVHVLNTLYWQRYQTSALSLLSRGSSLPLIQQFKSLNMSISFKLFSYFLDADCLIFEDLHESIMIFNQSLRRPESFQFRAKLILIVIFRLICVENRTSKSHMTQDEMFMLKALIDHQLRRGIICIKDSETVSSRDVIVDFSYEDETEV